MDARGGNWIGKLLEFVEERPEYGARGTVREVEVLHDSWCARLNGEGSCNCEPEIRPYRSPLRN